MTFAAWSERLMSMSDEVWARHANPWSGWSRLTVLPLLALSLWSRVWLGWGALLPLALTLAWVWLNPRVFPPPRDLSSWMTRGVLGERIWLDRAAHTLPPRLVAGCHALTILSALGALAMAWGLIRLDVVWTVAGMAVAMLAKLALVRLMAVIHDRVVWQRALAEADSDGAGRR
jgi:hypothetical protein